MSSSSSTVSPRNEAAFASTTEMLLKVSDMDLCIGRLEAAVVSESTNPLSTTTGSAVLEYVQQVRQSFDNMKDTIVDPLSGLNRILSVPVQPAAEAKIKCIHPYCTFWAKTGSELENHRQQIHSTVQPKAQIKGAIELIVNNSDAESGDDSNSDSTQPSPPPTPPPSSSSSSPATENNVQNDDGSEATNRTVQPLVDTLPRPEQDNNPEARIANNPGPNDNNENGAVRVVGGSGQGGASGGGGRGPEMEVVEVVVPVRIHVDDNMDLDIVNQNDHDDAGADDAGADDAGADDAGADDAGADDAGADVADVADVADDAADGDQEAPDPADNADDEVEQQEAVPIEQNPKRHRKKLDLFQLIEKNANKYFPTHKKSKAVPKLVLKRTDPQFNVIMGALRQSEASLQNVVQMPAAEREQILRNRRFQKMTIGLSTRRD